jgi:hypothetical protein
LESRPKRIKIGCDQDFLDSEPSTRAATTQNAVTWLFSLRLVVEQVSKCGYQFASDRGLGYKRLRSGFNCSCSDLRGIMLSDHYDSGLGSFFPDQAGRFQAIQTRHADVQNDNIRFQKLALLDRVNPIDCLPADLPFQGRLQESSKTPPENLVVVNN